MRPTCTRAPAARNVAKPAIRSVRTDHTSGAKKPTVARQPPKKLSPTSARSGSV